MRRSVARLCGKCRYASRKNRHLARSFTQASVPREVLRGLEPEAPDLTAVPARKRNPQDLIRVLCVDDDPLVREYLCTHLKASTGIEVAGVAASVEEACALLFEHPVDVVLLDYRLNGRSGVELLRIISEFFSRKGLAGKQPSVLFCTGLVTPALVDEIRALGSAGVLSKQEVARDLLPAVRSVAQGGLWFRTN